MLSSLIDYLLQGTCNAAAHSGGFGVVLGPGLDTQKGTHVPNGRISEYLQVSETASPAPPTPTVSHGTNNAYAIGADLRANSSVLRNSHDLSQTA